MLKHNCSLCNGVNRRHLIRLAGISVFASYVFNHSQAAAISSPKRPEDESYMRLALDEAKKGDFPFGAVIVCNGKVAAAGHNTGLKSNDPTAHGEIVAIHDFLSRNASSELKGATIYTTGEPCPMCMGAIVWCGFGRMVYGASIKQLSTRLGQIMITSSTIADAAQENKIEITGGILGSEALALFK
ncbi:MAG: nucleoside deaminase [Methylocystis sp.]